MSPRRFRALALALATVTTVALSAVTALGADAAVATSQSTPTPIATLPVTPPTDVIGVPATSPEPPDAVVPSTIPAEAPTPVTQIEPTPVTPVDPAVDTVSATAAEPPQVAAAPPVTPVDQIAVPSATAADQTAPVTTRIVSVPDGSGPDPAAVPLLAGTDAAPAVIEQAPVVSPTLPIATAPEAGALAGERATVAPVTSKPPVPATPRRPTATTPGLDVTPPAPFGQPQVNLAQTLARDAATPAVAQDVERRDETVTPSTKLATSLVAPDTTASESGPGSLLQYLAGYVVPGAASGSNVILLLFPLAMLLAAFTPRIPRLHLAGIVAQRGAGAPGYNPVALRPG